MSEKIFNQNIQPESKRTEKIDLTPLNVEKALKKLGSESGYLVLNQESKWILNNLR